MRERPGFMLYFELEPALSRLNDEEAGRLLKALMAYAQYGEVRELSGAEAVAFLMMRGRMDRDAETYRTKCRRNAYNAYVSAAKRRGELPVPYEEWDGERTQATVCERKPTAIPTAATDTTTDTTTDTIANPNTISNTIANTIANAAPNADQRRSSRASAAVDGDTAWVLSYLEERERTGKRSAGDRSAGGSAEKNRQGGMVCRSSSTG